MKRCVGLLVAAMVLLGGCADGDGRAREEPTRSASTQPPASPAETAAAAPPSRTVPTSTTVASRPAVQKVEDLLTVLAPLVPIPEDARACVAARLVGEPESVAELRATTARRGPPDGVMDAGTACMQELHALPAFLDAVDEQVDGGLGVKQRSCLEQGYLGLDPKVLDALTAEALGGRRDADATDRVRSMLHACGVDVGG